MSGERPINNCNSRCCHLLPLFVILRRQPHSYVCLFF